jgi:hypothetical protein
MIESIIWFLITVCIIAGLLYLVLYVLGAVGVPIPPKVVQIIWIIFMLVCLLLLLRLLLPLAGGHRKFLSMLFIPMFKGG